MVLSDTSTPGNITIYGHSRSDRSALEGCSDSKQPAGSSSEVPGKWGKKQNEPRWREKMRSCRGMPFITPLHSTPPHPSSDAYLIFHTSCILFTLTPASPFPSAFNSPRVLNSLYLSHQDTWHNLDDCFLQVERQLNRPLLPDHQGWRKNMTAGRRSGTWGGPLVADVANLTKPDFSELLYDC